MVRFWQTEPQFWFGFVIFKLLVLSYPLTYVNDEVLMSFTRLDLLTPVIFNHFIPFMIARYDYVSWNLSLVNVFVSYCTEWVRTELKGGCINTTVNHQIWFNRKFWLGFEKPKPNRNFYFHWPLVVYNKSTSLGRRALISTLDFEYFIIKIR